MAVNPLALKLGSFIDLTEGERAELESWCGNTKNFAPRKTLINEGDCTDNTCLILSGWAYRYKDLSDGQHQITGFLLPGDTCDLYGFLVRAADHNIATLSEAVVALAPCDVIRASLEREPRLMLALWWSSLVEQGIMREWLTNVGRRDSATRLASLFCELLFRAERIGLAAQGAFTLPLTQGELGDALGLTSVHVNRTLRVLRERKLLTFRGKQVVIEDVEALMSFAEFNPTYLQLERQA